MINLYSCERAKTIFSEVRFRDGEAKTVPTIKGKRSLVLSTGNGDLCLEGDYLIFQMFELSFPNEEGELCLNALHRAAGYNPELKRGSLNSLLDGAVDHFGHNHLVAFKRDGYAYFVDMTRTYEKGQAVLMMAIGKRSRGVIIRDIDVVVRGWIG